MKQKELFLIADAALRSVIDRIRPEQLDLPAPAAWSRTPDPTLRSILAAHARDEAWVPDVLAGRTMDEVGDRWDGDLLGADPIAAYDAINDTTTAAVRAFDDDTATAHLSYGDFPVHTFFEHTTFYRTFQSWDIAKLIGLPFSLPPELVDGVWQLVEPQLEQLRAIHVFGPEVRVPADADAETRLLGKTGFYHD
jgi:uncharacterized protein (TIGR03086 family)